VKVFAICAAWATAVLALPYAGHGRGRISLETWFHLQNDDDDEDDDDCDEGTTEDLQMR